MPALSRHFLILCLTAGMAQADLALDLGLSDADLAWDLTAPDADSIDAALADNAFVANPSDIYACWLAFDGALPLPDFSPAEQTTRATAAGHSLHDLCHCAASALTALGPGFEADIAAAPSPTRHYAAALADGIAICTTD